MRYIFFFFFFFFHIAQSPAQCESGGLQFGCQGCGGGLTHDILSTVSYGWFIQIVNSKDPNELEGSIGYQTGKWVSINDHILYIVRFENTATSATGPAQNVNIHFPVSHRINGNTLKIKGFGFGSNNYTLPTNNTTYATRLDVRDSLGLYVDVTAGLDVIQNEVFWTFKSIDPSTGQTPLSAGFLPVNDSATGKGEGYVSFLLTPSKTLLTSDTVTEQASIIFDQNDPIPTNTWTNTIDAFPPISHVIGATASNDTIRLHWSGVDDLGGVGVKDYALYVSEDGSAYTIYKNGLTDTTSMYVGNIGSTYRFFTLSTDNVGNKEALKSTAEATISLIGTGTLLPINWLYFEGRRQSDDALLTWAVASEQSCKNYVVERSLDARVFAEIGVVNANGNTLNTANYSYIDKDAAKLNTEHLFYRIRQVSLSNKSVYTKTISIPINHNATPSSITAYPNPFSNEITLKIIKVSPTEKDDIVQIYSMDGRLRYQKPLYVNGTSSVLLNDLPQLEPGNYLLKAIIDKQLFTIKMAHK